MLEPVPEGTLKRSPTRLACKFSKEIVAVGIDLNAVMLRRGVQLGEASGVRVARLVGRAETLPFCTPSFDALLCFNAVDHFDLVGFVRQASLVLRRSGRLFIYTRSEKQNRETIWGRFFPGFLERETRLQTTENFVRLLTTAGAFRNVRVRIIPWTLRTSLGRLVDQVHACHYSTFRFFPSGELSAAVNVFCDRVQQAFSDSENLEIFQTLTF